MLRIILVVFTLVPACAFAGSLPAVAGSVHATRTATGTVLGEALQGALRLVPEGGRYVGHSCFRALVTPEFECVVIFSLRDRVSSGSSSSSDEWVVTDEAGGRKFYRSRTLEEQQAARRARDVEAVRQGTLR